MSIKKIEERMASIGCELKTSYLIDNDIENHEKQSNDLWRGLSKDEKDKILEQSKRVIDDNYKFIGVENER